MDSYAIHQQRPLTPPNDRNKAQPQQDVGIQDKGDLTYMDRFEENSPSDLSHLSKQNANTTLPPVSTAPSAPSATVASANPFISRPDDSKPSILSDTPTDKPSILGDTPTDKPSILNDLPTQSTKRAQKIDDPFNDVRASASTSTNYSSGRNDTTHRIESEVLDILKWKNPVRSGAIFALIVGSIILTRWYSLLQIGSSLLTLAIGVNLIYVNFIMQGQKLVSSNQNASHPYDNVIHNDKHTMIDKQSVRHYSTVLTEVSETLIRALTRIVFIENTATSVKWMSIFFVIWKVSAHVSTMDIVLGLVISAFVFPRLYISNKDVVDAQIQKGQTMIQNGIEKAQSAATTAAQDTYIKSRAAFAKVGTTGTDAKNTMSKESVTVKED